MADWNEVLFRKQPDGTEVYYPFGAAGRGYVLRSPEDERRVRCAGVIASGSLYVVGHLSFSSGSP